MKAFFVRLNVFSNNNSQSTNIIQINEQFLNFDQFLSQLEPLWDGGSNEHQREIARVSKERLGMVRTRQMRFLDYVTRKEGLEQVVLFK